MPSEIAKTPCFRAIMMVFRVIGFVTSFFSHIHISAPCDWFWAGLKISGADG